MATKDLANLWIYTLRVLGLPTDGWVAEHPLDILNPWTGKPSRHRFDWAMPEYRIAVEIDGGVWMRHGGRHGTDADRIKLNLAVASGWRVFRFSPEMLKSNPETCVKVVYEAL